MTWVTRPNHASLTMCWLLLVAAAAVGCRRDPPSSAAPPAAEAPAAAQAPAAAEDDVACRVNALSATERTEQAAASKRILPAITEVTELARGYAFRLPADAPLIADVAVWMMREQRCCPFLTFALRFVPSKPEVWIETSGSPAAKQFVQETIVAELDARAGSGAP